MSASDEDGLAAAAGLEDRAARAQGEGQAQEEESQSQFQSQSQSQHPRDGFSVLRFAVRLLRREGEAENGAAQPRSQTGTSNSRPRDAVVHVQPVELCFHHDFDVLPDTPVSLHLQHASQVVRYHGAAPQLPTPTPPSYICHFRPVSLFPTGDACRDGDDDDFDDVAEAHPDGMAVWSQERSTELAERDTAGSAEDSEGDNEGFESEDENGAERRRPVKFTEWLRRFSLIFVVTIALLNILACCLTRHRGTTEAPPPHRSEQERDVIVTPPAVLPVHAHLLASVRLYAQILEEMEPLLFPSPDDKDTDTRSATHGEIYSDEGAHQRQALPPGTFQRLRDAVDRAAVKLPTALRRIITSANCSSTARTSPSQPTDRSTQGADSSEPAPGTAAAAAAAAAAHAPISAAKLYASLAARHIAHATVAWSHVSYELTAAWAQQAAQNVGYLAEDVELVANTTVRDESSARWRAEAGVLGPALRREDVLALAAAGPLLPWNAQGAGEGFEAAAVVTSVNAHFDVRVPRRSIPAAVGELQRIMERDLLAKMPAKDFCSGRGWFDWGFDEVSGIVADLEEGHVARDKDHSHGDDEESYHGTHTRGLLHMPPPSKVSELVCRFKHQVVDHWRHALSPERNPPRATNSKQSRRAQIPLVAEGAFGDLNSIGETWLEALLRHLVASKTALAELVALSEQVGRTCELDHPPSQHYYFPHRHRSTCRALLPAEPRTSTPDGLPLLLRDLIAALEADLTPLLARVVPAIVAGRRSCRLGGSVRQTWARLATGEGWVSGRWVRDDDHSETDESRRRPQPYVRVRTILRQGALPPLRAMAGELAALAEELIGLDGRVRERLARERRRDGELVFEEEDDEEGEEAYAYGDGVV